MDRDRSPSPGPACRKHVTPRSVSRSWLPVDLGSARARLSRECGFRGDELAIRERATIHGRRDACDTEDSAAGATQSCAMGILMHSVFLTEQEFRVGAGSSSSFEPN